MDKDEAALILLFELYLLVSLDPAFCGVRAAVKRSRGLHHRRFYLKALIRGWFFGQIAFGLTFGLAALLWSRHPDPGLIAVSYLIATRRLVRVYGIYALAMAFGWALRIIPSLHHRMNRLVFGLGIRYRPWVAVGGMAFAVWPVHSWPVVTVGGFGLITFLGLEPVLERVFPKG